MARGNVSRTACAVSPMSSVRAGASVFASISANSRAGISCRYSRGASVRHAPTSGHSLSGVALRPYSARDRLPPVALRVD